MFACLCFLSFVNRRPHVRTQRTDSTPPRALFVFSSVFAEAGGLSYFLLFWLKFCYAQTLLNLLEPQRVSVSRCGCVVTHQLRPYRQAHEVRWD